MSSLLENAKNEALSRIPARLGGREDPVERVESRGRRALNRVQAAARRSASGLGDAYDSAESRARRAIARRGASAPAPRRRAGAAGGAGAYFLRSDQRQAAPRRRARQGRSLFKRGEKARGPVSATATRLARRGPERHANPVTRRQLESRRAARRCAGRSWFDAPMPELPDQIDFDALPGGRHAGRPHHRRGGLSRGAQAGLEADDRLRS